MRHPTPWILCLLCPVLLAEDWPEFRGPTGQGHSAEQGLPVEWSEEKNVAWKVPIPGRGWSSPVLQDRRMWLTTALDQGKSLRLMSLDPKDGATLQDLEVFHLENPGPIHAKNSHASPTPLLQGNRIYVHFGSHGTAGLSTEGKLIWKTRLEYAHGHGAAGSPVLYRDLLILSCDGTDIQYVVSLDKHTGEIRWKRFRQGRMAYSTPLVIEANGRAQVVSTGGDSVVSYEPVTGSELWWLSYDGYSNVPRPVFGLGNVFIISGYTSPILFAIRPTGSGDIEKTHVAWSTRRAVPLNPSPLLVGKNLYLVSDKGIASCLDAENGSLHWRERLGGNFSASPIYADGKIYFLNEEGLTTVIAHGITFRKLATNQLEGRTQASMAVSGLAIYLRSEHHLYRLEKLVEEDD